jgi:hypothetical protein
MRSRAMVAAVVLAAMLIGATALSVLAKDDVIRRGACSGRSDWKLKLSEDNGRIEVEYEVDQNRVGDAWRVVSATTGTSCSRASGGPGRRAVRSVSDSCSATERATTSSEDAR